MSKTLPANTVAYVPDFKFPIGQVQSSKKENNMVSGKLLLEEKLKNEGLLVPSHVTPFIRVEFGQAVVLLDSSNGRVITHCNPYPFEYRKNDEEEEYEYCEVFDYSMSFYIVIDTDSGEHMIRVRLSDPFYEWLRYNVVIEWFPDDSPMNVTAFNWSLHWDTAPKRTKVNVIPGIYI